MMEINIYIDDGGKNCMNKKILRYMCSNAISQSKYNKKKTWKQLPDDQEKALNEMLGAIQEAAKIYTENMSKIKPQYKSQVIDAMILKAASAFGWSNKENHK